MNFRQKSLNKECVSIFSINLPEMFHILRRIQRDNVINVQTFHVNYPLFPSYYIKITFFDRFSKTPKVPNLTKIRPVGTELFHADRRMYGRT